MIKTPAKTLPTNLFAMFIIFRARVFVCMQERYVSQPGTLYGFVTSLLSFVLVNIVNTRRIIVVVVVLYCAGYFLQANIYANII